MTDEIQTAHSLINRTFFIFSIESNSRRHTSISNITSFKLKARKSHTNVFQIFDENVETFIARNSIFVVYVFARLQHENLFKKKSHVRNTKLRETDFKFVLENEKNSFHEAIFRKQFLFDDQMTYAADQMIHQSRRINFITNVENISAINTFVFEIDKNKTKFVFQSFSNLSLNDSSTSVKANINEIVSNSNVETKLTFKMRELSFSCCNCKCCFSQVQKSTIRTFTKLQISLNEKMNS